MSTVPTISSSPSTTVAAALTPAQTQAAVASIETAIKGKSVSEILAALPSAVESTYSLVQSYLVADTATIGNVVLAVVIEAVALSGLAPADILILDQVLSSCVPAIITLVAKYAPEVEQEIESGCSACFKWLKSKF